MIDTVGSRLNIQNETPKLAASWGIDHPRPVDVSNA